MRYAHSIFARRAFLFCLLFAGLCMTRPVLAIEKYAAVPLTDDGLGSTTRGLTKEGAGTLTVVGSKQKADGTVGAMYWSIAADPSDPTGNTVVATELPKPPGMSAWATGIVFLDRDPWEVICGYTGTTFMNEGSLRAVIWRRNASGQFVNTILDDQAAVAHAIVTQDTPLGLIIVVCGKFQLSNGAWHACLWKISNQGTQRTDLGTLGGQFGEAMGVLYVGGEGGVFQVVGSAQRSNGRTLAACWVVSHLLEEQGVSYFVKALSTPPGAESNAVYIGSANGGVWKTSGFIREPNGSTSASVWINQGETASSFVSQLYRDVLGRGGNTTANGIVDYIDDDDILVVGTRRNAAGRERGVGALPFNQAFDDPFFFDALRASDPVQDWYSIALNAVEPGGAIAGEALFSGAATSQAALFLPTNIEVPQAYAFAIGPNISDRISNLWQEDGNALRIHPRREGGVDRILAEWTSTRAIMGGASRAPRVLTLVSRIMPRHPNPTSPLTLTFQLYDSAFGVWVTVGIRSLLASTYGRGTFFRLDLDVPDPDRFKVSAGEPLRWRVGLRGEEWSVWDVDLMEMETEP